MKDTNTTELTGKVHEQLRERINLVGGRQVLKEFGNVHVLDLTTENGAKEMTMKLSVNDITGVTLELGGVDFSGQALRKLIEALTTKVEGLDGYEVAA